MITLRNWHLFRYNGIIMGRGTVSGHPRLRTDQFAHTSAVMRAKVEDGVLHMTTFSGNLYVLEPEWFNPRHLEETLACLPELGIGGDFMEHCVRAREEADARRLEEVAAALEPGELLVELIWMTTLRALFRTKGGTVTSLRPLGRWGSLQGEPWFTVLLTDWTGGTVDFRYRLYYDRIVPYHISDGLRTVKVRNLGSVYLLFGQEGREVVCDAGAVTAIPAAELGRDELLSPDAVNGKCIFRPPSDLANGEEKD